jgi:hypothetical protein
MQRQLFMLNFVEINQVAAALVDESGELNRKFLETLLQTTELSEQARYFLGRLATEPLLFREIKKIGRPLCHAGAEKLIRETVGIPDKTPLTDTHIRRAVISACLTPLRQSVGSCFATAPAILVHAEHIHVFITDLQDLLATGKLRRIVRGVEHTVPLSPSTGKGLEREAVSNRLLKAWEFTIASFADVKMEFSKWNLYASLGLHHSDPGGIGEVIYKSLEKRLEKSNADVEHHQAELEVAASQVRTTENLLKQSSSEAEIRRLQAEYQMRLNRFFVCQELRDKAAQAAHRYASFYSVFIEHLDIKFPEYFQEIYDAEMQDLHVGECDDTPAGFRLVYKHGRSDASVWSMIYTAQEWIEALASFFQMIEPSLQAAADDAIEKEIAEMVTAVITHVRSRRFLETALERMARRHNLYEAGEKKPWAYTSGGTMPTLLKTYFRREGEISEEKQWVESPTDLLIFILDTLKNLPASETDPFLRNRRKGMLMYSPTHAFILHPGWPFFMEGWQDSGFTYTWVRDQVIVPSQEHNAKVRISPEEQEAMAEQFVHQLHAPFFPFQEGASLKAFRSRMAECINHPSALDRLDSLLYSRFSRRALPFADTNWVNTVFSFVVGPGTDQLELWMTDPTAQTGSPISSWKRWLDGTDQIPWGLYTHTTQYTP